MTPRTATWAPSERPASAAPPVDDAEPPTSPSLAAWNLGTIAGIRIRVHATFFLLLAWIAATHLLRGERWPDVVAAVAFVVTVFGVVVLHELGHALTARHFGIKTRDITLLPIGGIARLDRMPERPRQEMAVAIAGPLVNVALALVVLGILWVLRARVGPISGPVAGPVAVAVPLLGGSFLTQLFWVNVALAVFNMLPAFPMDGGRVFRAALAMRFEYARATAIAASLGRMIAVVLGFIGLVANPMLVLVGVFIWVGGTEEAAYVQARSALAGLRVGGAMIVRFHTLAPDDAIARAVELTLGGFQSDFPVTREGRVVGLLAREDVLRALGERGAEAPVHSAMQRRFAVADVSAPLEQAMTQLRSSGAHVLPVLREGRLAGLLTLENIGEIAVARESERAHPRPSGEPVAVIE